jgi:hypothetical protein
VVGERGRVERGRLTAGMGRGAILAAMVLVSFVSIGAAGRERGAMGETIAWPSEAGGWREEGGAARYEGRAIYDYMDGAGEVYLAFNFKRLTVHRFERPDHPPLIAEFFEMASPADAFGVFAFDRQDPEAHIGQGSEFGGGLLRFWKGRYFASIYGEGEGSEQERAVLEIGKGLAAAIAERGEPPRLMEALPPQGRLEGSARFVRSHVLLNQRCFISQENVLQLGADTEAALARYDLGKGRTCLLLIRYPDQARAASAFAGFKRASMPQAPDRATTRTEDGTWTGAELHGTNVVIALHAPDERSARRLMEEAAARMKEERP